MKKTLLLLGLLLCFKVGTAQVSQQPVTVQNSPPVGACSYPAPAIMVTVAPNQGWWQCISGAWTHTTPASGGTAAQALVGSPTTPCGATITLNSSALTNQECVLSANLTVNFTAPTSGSLTSFALLLHQAASGGPYTVTWNGGVLWPGNAGTSSSPVMTATTSARDWYVCRVTHEVSTCVASQNF